MNYHDERKLRGWTDEKEAKELLVLTGTNWLLQENMSKKLDEKLSENQVYSIKILSKTTIANFSTKTSSPRSIIFQRFRMLYSKKTLFLSIETPARKAKREKNYGGRRFRKLKPTASQNAASQSRKRK